MRILISNPDGIGDFVLRQPMFAALRGAGHELLLVIQSFVAPIAPLVAPEASTVLLESDPYSSNFNPASTDVCRVLRAAVEFAPDVFCIAPYQRTEIDELLAESLNGCRIVSMTGFLFPGTIDSGQNHQSRIRIDRRVSVSLDQHEAEKNEQLCNELLGKRLRLPDPVIRAEESHLEGARSVINRLGVEPGKFWIACVGNNRWTAVKNWALESWARALSHGVAQHGQKFLMIGTPDESATTEQIRNLMGSYSDATENLCDSPQALGTVVGMLQLSAGYIGKDTGPMHLAAALGKPVIAIFGGGHWPRFTPRAKAGVIATVTMPCAGCDWACHLRDSYCVKRVPVETILEAMDSLQNEPLTDLRIQQLSMNPMLSARVIRESAAACRDLRRRLATAEHQRDAATKIHEQISIQQQKADRAIEQLACVTAERDRLEAEVRAERLKAQGAGRDAEKIQKQTEQLVCVTADRDRLEAEVRAERLKAQSARRDAEKIQRQTEADRQSILDVLNDLFVEHSTLKQTIDCEVADAVRLREQDSSAVRARLQAVEQSLSFRVGVRVGRPVVALHRKLRSLVSRPRN